MKKLIEYFKILFCNHELLFEECNGILRDEYDYDCIVKSGKKVSQTCKKCGYHKSYWKF